MSPTFKPPLAEVEPTGDDGREGKDEDVGPFCLDPMPIPALCCYLPCVHTCRNCT